MDERSIIRMKISNVLWVAAITLLIVWLYYRNSQLRKKVNQRDQLVGLMEASVDSLRSYYDKELGSLIYERQALVAERDLLLDYTEKRSKEVAELIRKYDAIAGAISNTEVGIDTLVAYDTVYIDSANRDIRQVRLKSDYYDIGVRSYPDSVKLSPLVFFNKQTIYLDEDGLVKVRNTNPYMKVTDLQGFRVQEPKRKSRFWLGFGLGVGTTVGAYYLVK